MPTRLGLIDRLRIERYVWTLDSFLYELPRRSRIEKRQETRQNLLAAASSVGAKQALSQIGTSSRLGRDYVGAELGERPRPAWMAVAIFLPGVVLVATALWTESARAYGDGIRAADPHATGTYTWPGMAYLQNAVTYTFADGRATERVGGSFSPLFWVLMIVGTVLVGRLWRIPMRRQQHTRVDEPR